MPRVHGLRIWWYITAPDGSCVVWGGYNVTLPPDDCTNLGTGQFDNPWPDDWNNANSEEYEATLDISAGSLQGQGEWTITILNGWATSGIVNYQLQFTIEGECLGDCDDPAACNFVPVDQQTNPLTDVCEYALDLFGPGYDCNGVCLNDSDGDGICDENDDCDGITDECGNCGAAKPQAARIPRLATTTRTLRATTEGACTSTLVVNAVEPTLLDAWTTLPATLIPMPPATMGRARRWTNAGSAAEQAPLGALIQWLATTMLTALQRVTMAPACMQTPLAFAVEFVPQMPTAMACVTPVTMTDIGLTWRPTPCTLRANWQAKPPTVFM